MSASHTGAVQVAALQGGVRTIDRQTLERFQREIQGSVAFPGDAAYKEATRIWNAMVSKRPALVIRAAATEDVARTIAFAHGEGVELSVRGGGTTSPDSPCPTAA